MEEQQWFLILHMRGMLFNAIVRMAVGQEQIDVTVVVVIEKLRSPATHQPGDSGDAEASGNIIKRGIVIVAVDGIHFLIDVGDEKILRQPS